jgi:ParB family chromosome partitioning protein
LEQSQTLPIDKLFESPLNPRHTYNEKKMEELIESVRAKGILMPLLVRPNNGRFEIAAGHRRYRAALKVKLPEIPVIIREMSDIDFLEILTIENLQREDLEPLDEAMGYRTLMEKANYEVASIAAKIGKSESYIYQRLKLLELIPEAQEQLAKEKITAGHAILIARLQPNEQKECLEAIKEDSFNQEIMSVRDLAKFIERQIHLDLNSASFSKKDPDLLPKAGPCTTCPKCTGFAPALFPDIKKKDTCTDPSCFNRKIEAYTACWLAKQSQDSDVPPLKLSGDSNYQRKKVPDSPAEAIPANLYHEITDKKKGSCEHAREGIITEGRNKGKVLTVCTDPKCKKHRGRHYEDTPDQARYRAQQRAQEEKRRNEEKIRVAIMDETMKRIKGDLSREDLVFLAGQLFEELWSEYEKKILSRHDVKPVKGQYTWDNRGPMKKFIGGLGKTDLYKLLMEMALIRNIETRHFGVKKKGDPLLDTAKRYGVDINKIEAEFRAQIKAKEAEKKAKAKKKSPTVKQKAPKKTIHDLAGTVPEKKIPCLNCANDQDNGGDCARDHFHIGDQKDYVCELKKPVQTSAKKKKK